MPERAKLCRMPARARRARLLLRLLLLLHFMVLYPAARAGRFRPEAPRRARRARGKGERDGWSAASERGAQRPESERAAPVGRARRVGKPGERRGSAQREGARKARVPAVMGDARRAARPRRACGARATAPPWPATCTKAPGTLYSYRLCYLVGLYLWSFGRGVLGLGRLRRRSLVLGCGGLLRCVLGRLWGLFCPVFARLFENPLDGASSAPSVDGHGCLLGGCWLKWMAHIKARKYRAMGVVFIGGSSCRALRRGACGRVG